jgi:hypothetical protein
MLLILYYNIHILTNLTIISSKAVVKNVLKLLAKCLSVTERLWEFQRVFRPESQCGLFKELTGLIL